MNLAISFDKYIKSIEENDLTKEIGKVFECTGLLIKGFISGCSVGSICEVFSANGQKKFLAEVVGFQDKKVLMMSLGSMIGVGYGSKIVLHQTRATISVGDEHLGRVLDGLGNPIDDLGDLHLTYEAPLYGEISKPLMRDNIRKPLAVGVRAIDGLLTVGKGQRVAIMAGSGVGKSMLLGQMARSTLADVNVIALIGERGREVKEFIESSLGPEGLAKSVIVAVTSDHSPLIRMRGAFLATAIAEHFAAQNKDVLLMMDSITRFSMAQREVGLSVGEPPTSKGYTPSVFSTLPKLLERAGNFNYKGSITGLYTVLVEGDDMDEPITDAVRSIVDGHIVLDRKIAQKGQYPAIDVLQSNSRVMRNVVSKSHLNAANVLRENIATYRDAEDLINIGAYKAGANPKIDRAIQLNDKINQFLKQGFDESSSFDSTSNALVALTESGRK